MSYDFNPFKRQLASTEDWLKRELQQIRTGQASPSILDGIQVDVFGARMAIKELASVTIEGARSLRIAPWDKTQSKEIEKAIMMGDLGLSVATDDQGLRVNFPELTEESRAQIAKLAKEKVEEAKKEVRRHRDDAIKDLQAKEKEGGMGKDEIFRLKNETQKMVDDANKKLEETSAKKEKEIIS